jgi:uncharacterized membrane protein (UPF0127 family)
MKSRFPLAITLLMAFFLSGCDRRPTTVEDFNSQEVTFPNGKRVLAEVMIQQVDLMRGMMFRDSIAPDRGMLFMHGRPGRYSYWMYQVRIPLDIIWLDRDRRIVEISANTPPCKTVASQCPQYGGHEDALYVLELGGGMAAKYGLKLGDTLRF